MKSRITNNVVALANVDDTNKIWLDMLVDKLFVDVKAYINQDIPEDLESAMTLRLVSYISDSGVFLTDEQRQANTPVSSITEGDTSVSYAVKQKATDVIGSADFLDKDFRRTLRHYRRVAW